MKKILKDGENGFIATNEDEWASKIELLINDAQLRKEIGI